MLSFKDQLGRDVLLPQLPERIVSLVPSQTELLYELGLEEKVVGITKFCIHPETWFRNKTRIGGTKTVHIEKLLSLQPDLVIANKEENIKEQVDALAEKLPVWISDIHTLEDACNMITGIGTLTGHRTQAGTLAAQIKTSFDELKDHVDTLTVSPLKCAYLIWKGPYMVAGGNTFIDDMLLRCGWQNVFARLDRYPSITLTDLQATGCQLVLLSSEPYPFKEKHVSAIKEALPEATVIIADGEMFSWYGSRLPKAASYFKKIVTDLNPSSEGVSAQ